MINNRVISFVIISFFIAVSACQVGPKQCGTKGCRCDKLAKLDNSCKYVLAKK